LETVEESKKYSTTWDSPKRSVQWGAADALRKAIGAPWLPLERRLYEPYLTAIRSRADQAVWTRAWEQGRSMMMDKAVAYALEDTEERV